MKKQRLVLIPKGENTKDDPKMIGLLCILDDYGYVFERIVVNK